MPVTSSQKNKTGADRYRFRQMGQPGDADLIYQWRNDLATRIASFDQGEKSWEDMQHSLEDWNRDDPLVPHLLAYDGNPVAFLRFSKPRLEAFASGSALEISIHVAPDARGHGHAKEALRRAGVLIKKTGYSQILAMVKGDNDISKRLFAACGYQHKGEEKVPGYEGLEALVYVCDLS